MLDRLESTHPGLGAYIRAAADYLNISPPALRERFSHGIERIGWETAEHACREWERLGILPDLQIESDRQVGDMEEPSVQGSPGVWSEVLPSRYG
jgi:hypothetical protein